MHYFFGRGPALDPAGDLTTPPDPVVGWGRSGGIPPPYTLPSTSTTSRSQPPCYTLPL